MVKEQKIFLEPTDDLGVVIEHITKSKAQRIILNIPEDSVLKSSVDKFHAIKEEETRKKKEVVIESVDPVVQELAEIAHLQSLNPVFGKGEKMISDIVPKKKHKEVYFFDKQKHDEAKDRSEAFFSYPPKSRIPKPKKRFMLPKLRKRGVTATVLAVILMVSAYFVAFNVLPRATVAVTLKKTYASFNSEVEVSSDTHLPKVDKGKIFIPGELIVAKSNISKRFPASGESQVLEKARGELYIYNEGTPVELVATTRFVSPEGLVFRLDKKTNIPGSGSKTKVSVTADKAGEDYNINPDSQAKWTIPGFKESGLTKYYNNVYAKAASPMTGGFTGVARVPTEKDIQLARETVRQELKNALLSQMKVTESPDLKLLPEATKFEIIKENISRVADDKGMFSIFAEGEMINVVFKEDTLKNILASGIDYGDKEMVVVGSKLGYSHIDVDWERGNINMVVDASFTLEPKVDKDSLKAEILGKNESVIKLVVFNIPGLTKAHISMWPFWVKSVPSDPDRVKLEFD